MADNYLLFSGILPQLTEEEAAWLKIQLENVCVLGQQEYAADDLSAGVYAGDADWTGPRFLRDDENCDSDCPAGVGFEYAFHQDDHPPEGWGRHLWIYSEDYGYVERVAHLVQKFLKRSRPEQCWSLTYAATCSKPRVGEFGGGAVFVTADEIRYQNAYDFVESKDAAFRHRLAGTNP